MANKTDCNWFCNRWLFSWANLHNTGKSKHSSKAIFFPFFPFKMFNFQFSIFFIDFCSTNLGWTIYFELSRFLRTPVDCIYFSIVWSDCRLLDLWWAIWFSFLQKCLDVDMDDANQCKLNCFNDLFHRYGSIVSWLWIYDWTKSGNLLENMLDHSHTTSNGSNPSVHTNFVQSIDIQKWILSILRIR